MTDDPIGTANPAVAPAEEAAVVAAGPVRAVAFFLGGQRYALPIERVNEIQQIVAFSDVPNNGSAVVGMVNLRGHVIPAVDMRRLVGLPEQPYGLETPMIIVSSTDHVVALVVDEVEDVLELPAECMQDTPPLHALASRMLGVCRLPDGLLNILDVDRLLTGDAIGEGR
jgi:purine-binding chemotaxis protein CheW